MKALLLFSERGKMDSKYVLTYSEIRSWKQCRLKHDYYYRQRLSAKGGDAHYGRRGNYVHGYIDRMYREVRAGKETIDDLIANLEADWKETVVNALKWGAIEDELKVEFAIIKGMILGYHQYFFLKEQWEGVDTEREVLLDVPDGGQFACKVDAIVKERGKYWVHDIKTVSSSSETDKKMLNIDEQFSHYCVVAGAKFNREFAGGIRTAIKTPGIKQTQKETVDEYCARVVRDYQSRPEFYMQRIYVERTAEQLEAYRQYLEQIYVEITNNKFVFRAPSMQCGMCDFIDLCTEPKQEVRNAMLVSDFFVRKKKHSELSLIAA